MYYRIGETLSPVERAEIAGWSTIAAVLRPEDLAGAALPPELLPPENMQKIENIRSCHLTLERSRILGELHIPARPQHAARHVIFVWWKDCLLFLDPDGVAGECVDRVLAMRPHHADGADDLLMDFFLALILEEPASIQQLEERIFGLEQAVLDNKTERFINQMSMLRRELNQRSRYYAQLRNLTNTLQENAVDLLDGCSQSRLQYVLRRLDSLCEEAEMLREYASQVSSEYQAQVDIAQNRIMKILTVVTTVCMPLSLIAGWYGMNFIGMPELSWEYGYPTVIALSALVVGCSILYFRKKHLW